MSLFGRSRAVMCFLVATAFVASGALGDTLELRSGQVIQGKFLDGSPLSIRFQVDGKIQTYATKDVLDIGFGDSDSGERAMPAPASASSPQQAAPLAAHAPAVSSVPVDAEQRTAAATSASAASAIPAQTPEKTVAAARTITIPAGTSLLVRMIDSVDSSTNKIGDSFQASLEAPLVVGDAVVAPKGADVYGKLAQAQQSGQLSGTAQLSLELTGIRINGQTVRIDSTDYDVAGSSRGKQSAERIGGGAVLGTLIGAIAGGGKGAAVGAAVGGGAGTAAQVLTHGPQVRVRSETLLEFKLQQPAIVQIPN